MCRLCQTERDKSGSYKDRSPAFFELTCDTHQVPMLILKEHRATLTPQEGEEVEALAKRFYPNRSPRGTGMHSIKGHWHEHYV